MASIKVSIKRTAKKLPKYKTSTPPVAKMPKLAGLKQWKSKYVLNKLK
jgi:hypothetical protein